MFSEDSSFPEQNGADMQFNPTNIVAESINLNDISSGIADWSLFSDVSGDDISLGGKHWIYVLNTPYQGDDETLNTNYDLFENWHLASRKKKLIPKITWVMPAMGNFSNNPQEWTEYGVSLRVTEPYGVRNSDENNGASKYRFNTSDILTVLNDEATQKEGLDMVNIVPNPYYGVSGYETGQVDNRVKIINLPKKCTISIYSINGLLIRQIKKDAETTEYEWDLKNRFGIPVASGVYIIHIDAPGIGEKVIKWFGSMRPIDLDSF